ncbi:hypothetical protein [Sulfitobacter sp. PM12]|uniref:hypothetical protein n=1 Tax=Sulfitobacter sp. PM12 TaxID=3138497 RepID=UPI00388DEA06
MAENTQIISGYIVRPNGDPFTEGVVRFTLGRSDTDEDEVIAAGKYVEFDIASDGSFAAELWPNTRGNVGGAYIVQVRETDRAPFETIGRVQVQDDGPYDLAALLRADIPQATNTFYSVLSQDEYDAFVAEMDAKVAEAQGYAESYDVAAISAAVTATGEDAVATAEDRVATGNDATATAADRIATGEDATATAADRVATGEDVIAAGNSAQAASDAAAAVPDIKTFDTYSESVTYGESNPAALIFCKEPMILFKGDAVFWRVTPYSPEALFAGGEAGAWYDPSDTSTLWQDTAGTIPVTADGQSVARMDDKSGNGNHATQATASKQPTYKTNGSLRWLSFDGVDDGMAVPSFDLTSTDKVNLYAGIERNSAGAKVVVELSSDWFSNTSSFTVSSGTGTSFYVSSSRGTATGSAAQGARWTTEESLPDAAVISADHSISGNLSRIRRNGVYGTNGTASKGAGNFGSYPFYIGARASSSLYFSGKIYGLIVRGSLSTGTEINDAETYLADKSGVTL